MKKKLNKKFYMILVVVIFCVIFLVSCYKKFHSVNNSSCKSSEEIINKILNISEYKLKAEITISSNKNRNVYVIEEEGKSNYSRQKVLEPDNVRDIEIENNNSTLSIRNLKYNFCKTFEEYPYNCGSALNLNFFIDKLKDDNDCSIDEDDSHLYICFDIDNNEYMDHAKLCISKNEGKFQNIVIQNSKNEDIIYIDYKEIESKCS